MATHAPPRCCTSQGRQRSHPIRVRSGRHWPRRTSQLAPIWLCQHARGTTGARVASEPWWRGRWNSTLRCRCRRFRNKKSERAKMLRHHESLAPSAPAIAGEGTTGAREASEPWWRGRRTRSLVAVAGRRWKRIKNTHSCEIIHRAQSQYSTLHYRNYVAARAPSTALRAVPPPPLSRGRIRSRR